MSSRTIKEMVNLKDKELYHTRLHGISWGGIVHSISCIYLSIKDQNLIHIQYSEHRNMNINVEFSLCFLCFNVLCFLGIYMLYNLLL